MLKAYEFYKEGDFKREIDLFWNKHDPDEEKYRDPFWRDYARVLHSPSFRRLKGKTQLFPGIESDFFRCRLTHSLEVAEIGKSIATKLNFKLEQDYISSGISYNPKFNLINLELVNLACIAHDLGHPPFGHQGEEVLDECMKTKNDGFEGNAQTLRILSVLEKKDYVQKSNIFEYSGIDDLGEDFRKGLNLCYRTLASIIKYNASFSNRQDKNKIFKGYYREENELVKTIWRNVVGGSFENMPADKIKTIECKIMDLSDDIAYSVYDLEDTFKGGFFNPIDIVSNTNVNEVFKHVSDEIISRGKKIGKSHFIDCEDFKVREILENLFFNEELETSLLVGERKETSNEIIEVISIESLAKIKSLTTNSFLRSAFCSSLITKYIHSVSLDINNEFPVLSEIKISPEIELEIEVLKRLTYYYQINSPKLKIVEFNGKNVVRNLFNTLNNKEGYKFLPNDVYSIVKLFEKNGKEEKIPRVISDFIAGMTNSFAIEFYNRLFSTSGISIHKPIN